MALLAAGLATHGTQALGQPKDEPEAEPGAFERSPIRLMLEEEGALSPDEPMYFVVGAADDGENDLIARFQFSFKYRIFDPGSILGREVGAARNLYFSYTQTSLWNWSEDSRPFEDTTYRPKFFWQSLGSGHGLWPDAWRYGYEHASNGQAAELSRSIDTLFLRPVWSTTVGGRELVVSPKISAYLETSDNPDIDEYRGNVQWLLRYGSETSWLLESRLRGASWGRRSVELNYSYPLRAPFFYRAGGFIYVQYLEGYGESLLGYNVKKDPTLRIGFAIVR